jgi:membrane fusion protein, heavy metal efflux system
LAYRRFLLAGLLVSAAACSSPQPEAPLAGAPPAETQTPSEVTLDAASLIRIQTAAVKQELAPETVEATGRIVPAEDRTWRIGAVVEGRIERTHVEVGDHVKQDALLAGMHSHDIHDSRADYRRAANEHQRAQSALIIATRQRDRAQRLLELKAGSSEQLDVAETEVVRSQAAVRAAEVEMYRGAQHITEILQVALDAPETHADDDLIPVKSPASGIVLKRLVTTGSVVTAGQELFVVTDLSRIIMIAQVPEAYLSRLRRGQRVPLHVQSYPEREFAGHIDRIGEELDPETRTIQVRIALANARGELKPEAYATASIPVGSAKPALFLPASAVQDIDGATCVFIDGGKGKFSLRPVAVGRTVGGRVELTDGVTAGEKVVIEGAFLLKSQLLKARLGE